MRNIFFGGGGVDRRRRHVNTLLRDTRGCPAAKLKSPNLRISRNMVAPSPRARYQRAARIRLSLTRQKGFSRSPALYPMIRANLS